MPCDVCDGTGAKDGAQPTTCQTCHGVGKIRAQQGFFTIERTCPTCQGRGTVIEDPCTACAGSGRKTEQKTLSVNVPKGVEDGTRIRLSGERSRLRGAPAGDLYIFISIAGHRIFQREGANIFCRVPCQMPPLVRKSKCPPSMAVAPRSRSRPAPRPAAIPSARQGHVRPAQPGPWRRISKPPLKPRST